MMMMMMDDPGGMRVRPTINLQTNNIPIERGFNGPIDWTEGLGVV